MVSYTLEEIGEGDVKIVWTGKRLPLTSMENLRKMYDGVEFESSFITTKQCKQFCSDFKKALQNSLGAEYNVKVNVGHFYISGFVEKNGKFVYFNVEDLRENGNEFNSVLYRTAKNDRDFTGGTNSYSKLENLDLKIKHLLDI